MKNLIILLSMLFAVESFSRTTFLPENDMNIPVDAINYAVDQEAEFNRVIDTVDKHFSPVVEAMGSRLRFIRDWRDGTVNAYAYPSGNTKYIKMFGGLARHPRVTSDALMLVVCHELGHHIGGAVMIPNSWASNEGQSDYYAANKCFKRILSSEINLDREDSEELIPLKCGMYKWMSKNWRQCRRDIRNYKKRFRKQCKADFPGWRNRRARWNCYKQWDQPKNLVEEYEVINQPCDIYPNKKDQMICDRTIEAGKAVTAMFADMRGIRIPQVYTPSAKIVRYTSHTHPAPQCRLDTFVAGAVCEKSFDEEISSVDYSKGYCTRESSSVGYRPSCWFAP